MIFRRIIVSTMAGFSLLSCTQAISGNIGTPVSDFESEFLRFPWGHLMAKSPSPHTEQPLNYVHPPLPEAPVIRTLSGSNELTATLKVDFTKHTFTTFQHGQQVAKELTLRSYNGALMGPTLVARPGDTLRIRLINKLPTDARTPHCDQGHCDHNIPHNFNITNLHTHGLHVDPTGNSDNVFIRLGQGEHFDYRIRIPEDHPAGTFWYHSHVHGATSVQVGSGMAGALIIQGDYDRAPGLRHLKDNVILLQEIAFDQNGRIENNDNYAPTAWADHASSNGWHISLNGAVMPDLHLRPGEPQRLRLIHAGVRKLLNLRLISACDDTPPIPLIQIASDGIPHRSKRLADDHGVFLAPGYRSDVVARASRPGVYYLVDTLDKHATETLPDAYCNASRNGSSLVLGEHAHGIVARVIVSGKPKFRLYPPNRVLARLNRPESIHDDELSPEPEYVEFDIDLGVSPWKGLVNGKPYDPSRPRVLKVDEAQTWWVTSAFSHHPFHLHVNPFEVIERDETGRIVDRYWKDTLNIPEFNPTDIAGTRKEIRTRYETFTGAYVMHCHILDHGDRGMMEKIIIEK